MTAFQELDEVQLDEMARRRAAYAKVAHDPQYDPSDFGLPLDEDECSVQDCEAAGVIDALSGEVFCEHHRALLDRDYDPRDRDDLGN